MGLFSSYFNKPGPGVEKDGPEKHRIWQFFEIFWGQLSKLSLINMIYFVAMIPLALGLYLCFSIDFEAPSFIVLRTPGSIDLIGLIMLVASIFVTFPATLGFTFVLRNIQRREHAWIWHDFIKHIKANYKKGVLNGIVTLCGYYIMINAHTMYCSQLVFGSGYINTFLATVMIGIILLFTWAQFYVNTMIVTFDLRLRDIYKNSVLFAISRVPMNLVISIICILLAFGLYVLWLIIPPLALLIVFLIALSLFGFITVFSIYPTIDKYMISATKTREDDEQNVFSDKLSETQNPEDTL